MAPDAFDLLGIPARFDLDPAEIQRRYLARAAALHPDAAPDDPEGPLAAARLNDALAVLVDPERRAGVLLARLGGPAPEQDRSLPPEFLAEVMEVREAVDGALASGDVTEVERWRGWAKQRRREFIASASRAFDAAGAGGDQELRDIRRDLNAWRYVERMIQQLGA